MSDRKDSVCQRGSGRLNVKIAQSFSPEKVVIVSKKNRRKESMKSLFANEEIILPSWLKILLETIDSETIQKLSENQEYRKMQIRRKELLEHYPIIEKVIDDVGKVSISEQEHKALLEYFLVKDRMENEERLYHYLYGHIHCYEYMKKIGVIKHENQ